MYLPEILISLFIGLLVATIFISWIWAITDIWRGKWSLFTLFKPLLVLFCPVAGIVFHIFTSKRIKQGKQTNYGILQ